MKNSTLFQKVSVTLIALFALSFTNLSAQSLSFSPSAQTIVAGGSITFTANPSNNGWSGSGNTYTYTWSATGGLTIPGTNPETGQDGSDHSKTISFPSPGTYTVSCTVTRGTTTRTGTATITVTAPPSPAVTLTPTPTASINVGGTVNFTATTSNFAGSGTITYTWSVSPGTPGTEYTIPAGNSNSKNITFNAAGSYDVTVVASRSTSNATSSATTVTVFQPNLYSTSGTGAVQAFNVNPVLGTIIDGPVAIFTPSVNTAGLGKNKVNANDSKGNLYYIPNSSTNGGSVTIYSAAPDGSTNTNVGSFDMNGGSTEDLGFVRMGFDANGRGWIIAGNGTTAIYIASFQGNGNNPISNVNTFNNATLTVSGGLASDFQSGDLAISASGVLYALANSSSGTFIYTLNSLATPTTVTRKWTVQTGGAAFTGNVNGVAWTQTGSMHISTSTGLYFIDQTTANQASGTVQASLVSSISGLTDLASSEFPAQSTLPVTYGDFNVKKTGTNAELNWTTLSETNNNYFMVERSEDGIHYKQAGTVNGNGTSAAKQTYSFADPITTSAGVLYYRLRQVDIDGRQNISNVVSLRLNGSVLANFSVYPNPFVSDIRLKVVSDKQEEMTVKISTATGQLVISKKVNLQKGENLVVIPDIGSLKTGIYIVETISNSWKHTERITKQ